MVVEPLSSDPTQSPAHSFVPRTVPTSLQPIALSALPEPAAFTGFGRRTLSEYSARKADSNENDKRPHRQFTRFASRQPRLISESIPQSIRALRAAPPGSSKLIVYRMTQPRSFTSLHRAGRSARPKLRSLKRNKKDVARRARRAMFARIVTVTDFTAGTVRKRELSRTCCFPCNRNHGCSRARYPQ